MNRPTSELYRLSDQGFNAVVAAYELEWQNTLDILQGEILRQAAPIRRLEEETERLRAQEVENAHIREAMEVENAQLHEAMMQREHQAQAEIEELRAKLHTALAVGAKAAREEGGYEDLYCLCYSMVVEVMVCHPHFIDVQNPIAKAIVCPEFTQTDAADVLFKDLSSGFNVEEMGQIYAIINSRFCEQLEDGPADCYLAAVCLDPHIAILHNPLSLKIKIPPIPSTAAPDILTSPTYVRVLKYLKIVIEAEFNSQHHSALKGKQLSMFMKLL
ncbi:uncharacterized protein F5891DRAFT_984984 [Suillus fuscotomentosus]|uniref:Uncharacterized protein n=1 Tax=Suillus fuscotomentosus TaxID=1912939 RepID=A0AAD4DXL5_9AGAM|nr:uncharacterized protein F5891DRAFT_984984 [Suillus fuscotomentosus]KAG1894483.1 hypothetical protein F5891DRAFT_984984 [Suillus fuscotomentosus]